MCNCNDGIWESFEISRIFQRLLASLYCLYRKLENWNDVFVIWNGRRKGVTHYENRRRQNWLLRSVRGNSMRTWNGEIIASWRTEKNGCKRMKFSLSTYRIFYQHLVPSENRTIPFPFLPFSSSFSLLEGFGIKRKKRAERGISLPTLKSRARRFPSHVEGIKKHDTGKNLTMLRLETFTFSISLLNNFLNIETQYRCSKRLNDEIITIYIYVYVK